MERDEAAIQKQKEEAKSIAQQKRNDQYVAEVKAAWEAKLAATGKPLLGAPTPVKDKCTQKETTQPAAMDMPSTTTCTPLKHSATPERSKPRKKAKSFKIDSQVTTLMEGNLNDIENVIHEATQEAVDEAMSEQHIVLGELQTQLRELGPRLARVGTNSSIETSDMTAATPLLKVQVANSTPILVGTLVTNQLMDRAILERFTRLGLNVATLMCDSLQ